MMKKDLEGSDKENLEVHEASSEKPSPQPEPSPRVKSQSVTINTLNDCADRVMAGSIPCLSSSLRWRDSVDEQLQSRRQSEGVLSAPSLTAFRKSITPKNIFSRGNISRGSVTSVGSLRQPNDFDAMSLLEEHRRRSTLSVCDVLIERDEAVLRGLLRQWSEQNRLELKNYLTDMKVDKTFLSLRNAPSSDDEGIRYCSTSPGQMLSDRRNTTGTVFREQKSGSSAFVKLKPLTEEELKLVPRDEEGNLTSIGSIGHEAGHCRPCAFHKNPKKQVGCANDTACPFCHFDHSVRQKKEKKTPKRQRRRARKKISDAAAGPSSGTVNLYNGSRNNFDGFFYPVETADLQAYPFPENGRPFPELYPPYPYPNEFPMIQDANLPFYQRTGGGGGIPSNQQSAVISLLADGQAAYRREFNKRKQQTPFSFPTSAAAPSGNARRQPRPPRY